MSMPRAPSLAFVAENNSFKESLLKEKFPENKIAQVLDLRRPSENLKVVSLPLFAQGLLKLELNDEQMNVAIKNLYSEDVDKLSLVEFTNKYSKDSVAVQTLSSDEKEMKTKELEADRVLLKCKYNLLKNKEDENGQEIRKLLSQINKKIKEFSVNAKAQDGNSGTN